MTAATIRMAQDALFFAMLFAPSDRFGGIPFETLFCY
jgi:hypothetical protein